MNATHPTLVAPTRRNCQVRVVVAVGPPSGMQKDQTRLLPPPSFSVVSVCLEGSARELPPPVARPQTRDPFASARHIYPIRPSGRMGQPVVVWCRAMEHHVQILLLEG